MSRMSEHLCPCCGKPSAVSLVDRILEECKPGMAEMAGTSLGTAFLLMGGGFSVAIGALAAKYPNMTMKEMHLLLMDAKETLNIPVDEATHQKIQLMAARGSLN